MSSLYPSAALPWTSDLKSLVALKSDENVLKTSIIQILCTEPGERVMRENFGSSLLRQVFEPGTSATASDIRSMVVGGVRKWDPRIAITSCETTMIGNEMKVSIGLKNVKDPRETSAIMLDFNITPNGISVNR